MWGGEGRRPVQVWTVAGGCGEREISGVWIGLVAAGVFLILLIIFIAQNLNDAPIHFLGLNGQVSIGLALLLAGVCGLIIAAVPASARIWQLRKALKKNARHDLPPPT